MTDIAKLGIEVDSRQVKKADKSLKGLAKTGQKTEKQADSLTSSFKRMAGPLVTLAGAISAVNKAMSVQREFDKLNAQLVTATGSVENAAGAFKILEKFASETPFALNQSVKAFTQLVNLGLNPSERALIAYGDTASALGKDLNQMIEAVADASVGEFERLKEFGIKAKSEGDNVSFTFKGVTTTVKKEAASIEGFLINLGETNFAGNMTRQMDTLDGAVSNLGDSWDGLFRTINEGGAGDAMEDVVRQATGAVDDLNIMLKSGEFDAYFDTVLTGFNGFGHDLDLFAADASEVFGGLSEFIGVSGQEGVDTFVSAFTQLPQNLRATVQIMAVELGHFVQSGQLSAEEWLENLGTNFVLAVDIATITGKKMQDALNPFADDVDFTEELKKALKEADDRVAESVSVREDEIGRLNDARMESISFILSERDATIAAQDEMIIKAKELRAVFEADSAKPSGKLSDFVTPSVQSGGDDSEEGKAKKKIDDAKVAAVKEADDLQELMSSAIVDGVNNGAESALDSFARMLQQMALQAAASAIMEGVFNTSSAPTAGGGGASSGQKFDWMSAIGSVIGFFDKGGNIPSGEFGIAGENGPEIIQGPANVTSTKDTAAAMSGGGSNIGNINITMSGINNPNEARIAAGQVARQINSAVADSQRFA